VEKTT